ncbi:MAG: conserved rane protein of unknown function [Chloroflexi bacterium]|nr:conserved rane protein of unknown function [Chloroflexota bacterium]
MASLAPSVPPEHVGPRARRWPIPDNRWHGVSDPPLSLALLCSGGCGFLALGLYLRTTAPTISWAHGGADGGDLITAAYLLGIPHPTGYPLWVLAAHVATWVPVGDVAFRVNAFSALCGALTVGLVAACTVKIAQRLEAESPPTLGPALAGSAAGLAFAISPMLWSQSTIAEVMTMHTALVSALLLLALRVEGARQSKTTLFELGLVAGASLSVHRTALLSVLAVAPLLVRPWRKTQWPQFAIAALGVALGLAPYALLSLRAGAAPAADWGHPATIEAFLHHVSGADYGYLLTIVPLPQALERFATIPHQVAEQFTWLGFGLVLLGGYRLATRDRNTSIALAVTFSANVVFALLYGGEGSESYLLPAFGVAAIWLGLGLLALVDAMRNHGFVVQTSVAAVCTAVLLVAGAQRAPSLDLSDDRQARTLAEATLIAAAPDTMVFRSDDAAAFTLRYLQAVEGLRPDVAVVDPRLLRFQWYRDGLETLYPSIPEIKLLHAQ